MHLGHCVPLQLYLRNKFLEVELQEQMVHAFEIFTDFAKSPSTGAVSIYPSPAVYHGNACLCLSQTVLSVFWVPRCGPQTPRLFWPAYPRLRTAPHQEKVARSQRSTDEYLRGTLHLLLQIQLSPRKSAAFLALGT